MGILSKTANLLLDRIGMELRAKPSPQRDMTMEGALRRTASHGFPVQTVIDVGASNGKWSRNAMKALGDADFLLVDPLAERRAALEKFKAEHPGRVDCAIVAAGDRDAEVSFHVADDLDGSGIDAAGSAGARTVPMRRLDTLARDRSLRGPYLIKLDTHGFEVPILEGAREVLRETSVLIIEVYNFELHERCLRFHEMCAWLEREVGFRCYDLADPFVRLKDGAFWQMDLFFTPANSALFSCKSYR